MERKQVGTRINQFGINRFDVAPGTQARIVLLSQEMCVKNLAFDDINRRTVEVDQEAVLKYKFKNPYTVGLFLVAKLNTDQEGKVVPGADGDKFVIEYMKLSVTQANELNGLLQEQSNVVSIKVEKQAKKGPDGKDFSQLKFFPSTKDNLPESLKANLELIQNSEERLEALWEFVDISTSITIEEYSKFLNSLPEGDPGRAMLPAAEPVRAQLSEGSSRTKSRLNNSEAEDAKPVVNEHASKEIDDFGAGDDFN